MMFEKLWAEYCLNKFLAVEARWLFKHVKTGEFFLSKINEQKNSHEYYGILMDFNHEKKTVILFSGMYSPTNIVEKSLDEL